MEPDRNLRAVLKVIPKDCYDNPTWKGLLYILRDTLIYAAVVAGLIVVDDWRGLIPLWILGGLSISALFILGHDAAHKALFASKRLNRVAAQFCFLPSLHIHEGWVFGHNRLHHGHTVRQQMDFVWHPTSPAEYARLSWFRKLAHRLYWSPIGAGIYYTFDVWWTKMMVFAPPEKQAREHLIEKSLVLSYLFLASAGLFAGGYFAGGESALAGLWMWTKVFLIPFVLWNYSIGLTVYLNHISEDIAWRQRQAWDRFGGQVEGTTLIHLPWFLNFFYHNIFLHIAHHVDTRIPFYGLPRANAAIKEHYGDVIVEKRLSLWDYLRTTHRCKLFDFETGRWHRYGDVAPEGSASPASPAAQGTHEALLTPAAAAGASE